MHEIGEGLTEGEAALKQDTVKNLLKTLADRFELDDKQAHDYYRRRGRKLELYWNGIQNIYYDYVSGTFNFISERPDEMDDDEWEEYNTVINIFRAYGESIIAAAGAGVPHTRFFPADADNPEDILAAKAKSKLSELIGHQNNAEFFFVHALYILWTQTLLGFYNYAHTDKSYGTISQPVYQLKDVDVTQSVCPECGFETTDPEVTLCPTCEEPVPLEEETLKDSVVEQSGTEEIPKSREIIEVYGTANIKVPYYVKSIKDAPYLILETEHHISLWRELYPDFYDDIQPMASDPENFRRPADGYTFDNQGLLTGKRYWFRPWAYNYLGNREEAELLRSEYPDGVYFVRLNDIIVECRAEDMDKHWTLYREPLSSHINSQPLGEGVIPIQDMRNDLVYLSIDTIKHGIGETFVDSDVLNWDTYGKHRGKPGTVIPVNRKRKDTSLDASFYNSKTAVLSKEVNEFFFMLNRDGEFISRAMPSIFGAAEQGGSQTLGEHESKRTQALQRLALPWKALNHAYAECMKKSVDEFVENMLEDEKIVKPLGSSGYVNVWVRMGELGGKTGNVISESSEQFPLSWPQKNAKMMEMLQLGKEPIDATLFHPENVTTVSQIFGMPDLHIPGEDDRNKQLMEILELLQGQVMMPMQQSPEEELMGVPPPPPQPSIPIEPGIDNDLIHIETIKAWANSESGLEAKRTNPTGYANVMAHRMMHEANMPAPAPMEGEKAAEEEAEVENAGS